MRLSFIHKVFLTLLVLTVLVIAGMYLFIQNSFERGFIDFIEQRQQQRIAFLSERLTQIYEQDRNWDRFRKQRRLLFQLFRERPQHKAEDSTASPGPPPGWRPPPPMMGRHHPPPIPFLIALLDAEHNRVAGRIRDKEAASLHPIEFDGQTIGYLAVSKTPYREQLDIRLEQEMQNSLFTIALAAMLLSLLLAAPLAYALLRPLRHIADTTKKLALGDYQARLPVTSRDEIGRLALDINDLARALQNTEQSRRQWVADISHELRTPIAILRGEIEALQDGIIPLDENALASIHAETMRLNRLVDELYQLSLSDVGALRYNKENLEPLSLLKEICDNYRHEFERKGISIELDNRLNGAISLRADRDRMAQLFTNLLSNSCKYTTDGGRLRIVIQRQRQSLIFDIEDSAPAVPEQALAHLFDRFYRVDSSRNRETGGAGLGLALCRNIVEAHDGHINASLSELGGLHIRIELPVAL
jgi:two-component system sensor histidine kinase BaeS